MTGSRSVDVVSNLPKHSNVFFIAKCAVDGKEIAYYSFKTMTNVLALVEFTFDGAGGAKVRLKTEQEAFSPLF